MRKLATASFSYALSILMCHYLVPQAYRLWLIIPLAIFAGAVFLFRRKIRIRILFICIFLCLGILRYDFHAKEYLGLENSLESDYRITAYVAEFPVIYDNYSKITVYLRSDGFPNVKTILYDYENSIADLKPGDMLRTNVRFTSASVSSGKETDNYISKGIYLRGTIKDEIKCYETVWEKLLFAPLYAAHEIQNILDEYLTPRASVFMKALITGEKTSLYEYPEIYRILQKAGLSHVVAVSGMHVSFLVGMLMMLFGNRRGWVASVLSLGIFALMTGMSPSVLRASFMQLLYLLAPVLRRESDGITSIAFALLILLTVNPFAVASVSLQLSFASVLGIIILTPRVMGWFLERGYNLKGLLKRIYILIATSLSATLGASIFTIPLCAYYFGNVSLLAPLSNLLVLWIVPFCFGLGFILCIISIVSCELATIIAGCLSFMVEFIYMVAELISSIPYSNIYLPRNVMMFWLISVFVVIGITYFVKGERLYKPTPSICITTITLFGLLFCVKHYYANGTTIAAIDVGQGQCIAILSGEETILIDCGGDYDSGKTVVNWLAERGREDVDCVMITHFDKDHTNGLTELVAQTNVKEILFCSLNLSEYEYSLLNEIKENSEQKNVLLTLVNRSQDRRQGEIDIKMFVPNHPEGNNGLIFLVSIGAFDALITGDADMETESEMMRLLHLPDGECLVVGHHGSKYSTSEELIDRFNPDFAIISSGYNRYGHPTQEVLDRLNQRNVVVYRTDELGSIEIKVR